jgi:hypothetical protein
MTLSLEEELAVVQRELADKVQERESRERDSHARIVDEDRFMVSLLRMEKQIRELRLEEERLKKVIEEGE